MLAKRRRQLWIGIILCVCVGDHGVTYLFLLIPEDLQALSIAHREQCPGRNALLNTCARTHIHTQTHICRGSTQALQRHALSMCVCECERVSASVAMCVCMRVCACVTLTFHHSVLSSLQEHA